jgi:hypothetical protein
VSRVVKVESNLKRRFSSSPGRRNRAKKRSKRKSKKRVSKKWRSRSPRCIPRKVAPPSSSRIWDPQGTQMNLIITFRVGRVWIRAMKREK